MRLRLTRRAARDIAAIADYLRDRDPEAARRVGAALRQSFDNLTRFPFSGRRQTVEAVRKLVVSRYPYLVYYMVDEALGEVVVLAVKHAAQHRAHSDL